MSIGGGGRCRASRELRAASLINWACELRVATTASAREPRKLLSAQARADKWAPLANVVLVHASCATGAQLGPSCARHKCIDDETKVEPMGLCARATNASATRAESRGSVAFVAGAALAVQFNSCAIRAYDWLALSGGALLLSQLAHCCVAH